MRLKLYIVIQQSKPRTGLRSALVFVKAVSRTEALRKALEEFPDYIAVEERDAYKPVATAIVQGEDWDALDISPRYL